MIDAIKALSKLPAPARAALGGLEDQALQALADWLSGEEGHPEPTDVLERVPELKSDLALARAEQRAKAAEADAARQQSP